MWQNFNFMGNPPTGKCVATDTYSLSFFGTYRAETGGAASGSSHSGTLVVFCLRDHNNNIIPSGGLSSGALAAIIVAVLVCLLALAVVAGVVIRRRFQRRALSKALEVSDTPYIAANPDG